MVEALLNVLFNFNYLKIGCVLFSSLSFLTSLKFFQTYLSFQKKIKLEVYANLPKPNFIYANCNVLTLG
jgi:hypothetical protein